MLEVSVHQLVVKLLFQILHCHQKFLTDSSVALPLLLLLLCSLFLLPGKVIREGCVAVHGAGTAAALQLCEPTVHSGERDVVLAPERVLLQTPALPGTTGPHGHHGQPGPVPSHVSARVKKMHIHSQNRPSVCTHTGSLSLVLHSSHVFPYLVNRYLHINAETVDKRQEFVIGRVLVFHL